MAKKAKSWEHRLSGKPDQLAINFVESLSYDYRLYKYDIAGSIAHSQMLAEQAIITKTEAIKIKNGLLDIQKQIEKGKFNFDPVYEDIHMAIESALIEKIGEAGKKLHTGRSRNDQVATDMRLWMRDEIDTICRYIINFQTAIVQSAEKYSQGIMPSYTHLQRAQPVCIACYLLAYAEMLERDKIRFENCQKLANVSPLGAGAVAGSTLPLNRKSAAAKLGFDDITKNSIDSISDRDFCAEFIFCCATTATHLSRLAEDFIVFSSSEFAFINIDDKYCTSSSMMPQKKNPDMLELIRGKSAAVFGALTAIMTMLKAQPLSYNRDMQEDKLHLFKAADTTNDCLQMAAAIVSNTKFNTDHIQAGMDKGFLDATALAEYLVNKSVPFRQAHGIVGAIVAHCEKFNAPIASLDISQLKKFCPKIQADVYQYLGSNGIVKNYKTDGAGGFKQAKQQLAFWRKKLPNLS